MPPGMNIIDKESSEEESIGPKLPQHLKNSKRDYSKTESFHIVNISHGNGPITSLSSSLLELSPFGCMSGGNDGPLL
jgi:hypothetical protein